MGQYAAKQFDDAYLDPAVIGAHYQVGKSAYFEVQLALAELAESRSGGGGLAGNASLIQVVAGAGGGPRGPRCPHVDEWVWTANRKPVRASALIGKSGLVLYNPITRNFNNLVSAELVKDQPLVQSVTGKGIKAVTSASHKVIQSVYDKTGRRLTDYVIGDAILSFDEGKDGKQKNWNIYSDVLAEMNSAETGDVVTITLATEYIYASGTDKTAGIVAHNVKPLEE